MSGFRDTFTKEEGEEKNLEYDDSAFLYFAGVLLMVIIIPISYHFIKYRVFKVETSEAPIRVCPESQSCACSVCQNKRSQLQQGPKESSRLGFFLELIVLLFFVYLFYLTCVQIKESPEGIKGFDPYEILEIDVGAPPEDIKAAFRKLSRVWHPDKNRGDPSAQSKYITITKAYETLTDELARSNFERFGNPDGPSPRKHGIGLPKYLLNPENQISILIVVFLIIIVIIPGIVVMWINTSQRVDKNGVLQENAQLYARFLNENLNLQRCLFILAVSREFDVITVPRNENTQMNKLRVEYAKYLPKRKDIHPRILKIMIMLLLYLHRKPLLPSMKKDMQLVLSKVPSMIETMIDVAFALNMMPRGKRMSDRTFVLLVELGQLITQGLMIFAPNMLMLPHIKYDHLKLLSAKKKPHVYDVSDLSKIEQAMIPAKVEDIKETLRNLPKLKVEVTVFVDDEEAENITTDDFVTIKIRIERLQLNEGQKAGTVHSQQFPFSKFEKLWVFIFAPDSQRLIFQKPVLSLEREIELTECKFRVGGGGANLQPGKHTVEVHVKSDSYYGLDVIQVTEFEVETGLGEERKVYVHPDDANLEKNRSTLQSLLAGGHPGDSTSEDEEVIPELEGEDELMDDFDPE